MVAARTKQPGHRDLRAVLVRTSGIKTRAQSATWLALVPVPDPRPRASGERGTLIRRKPSASCCRDWTGSSHPLKIKARKTEAEKNRNSRQILACSGQGGRQRQQKSERSWREQLLCEKTSDRKTNTGQQNQGTDALHETEAHSVSRKSK
jgi:hypothetical protein